jgi:CDP-glucose 4,6-dehydratase
MFDATYFSKTVALTGDTGFKSSWLAMWLLRLGANVKGYALKPPTKTSLFESCGLEQRIEHCHGDIRDTEKVEDWLRKSRPDFLFHLAAAPLVLASYADPACTFDVNVMGTISVLEAVRRVKAPLNIVAISTDKCYYNREEDYAYREDDPLGGHDPYSASKAAMEIAVASYRESFFSNPTTGVRLASARAGNVIGGGDWALDRIVPDAVRAFSQGKPLQVRHPEAVRPWQHVLEPLSGYLCLGAKLAQPDGASFATGWNFGPLPTQTHTVGEVADAAASAWGAGAKWQHTPTAQRLHEAGLLKLSIDRARARLDWEPVWPFATTMARTIGCYRELLAPGAGVESSFAACTADILACEEAGSAQNLAWTRARAQAWNS